jgi:hypothetical protein
MVASGFSLRTTVVLLSTIHNYTLSFVMEEQAVFPTPGAHTARRKARGSTGRATNTQEKMTEKLLARWERRDSNPRVGTRCSGFRP